MLMGVDCERPSAALYGLYQAVGWRLFTVIQKSVEA